MREMCYNNKRCARCLKLWEQNLANSIVTGNFQCVGGDIRQKGKTKCRGGGVYGIQREWKL